FRGSMAIVQYRRARSRTIADAPFRAGMANTPERGTARAGVAGCSRHGVVKGFRPERGSKQWLCGSGVSVSRQIDWREALRKHYSDMAASQGVAYALKDLAAERSVMRHDLQVQEAHRMESLAELDLIEH